MKYQDSMVRGEGLDIAVRDWGGSGLPILFLPGGGNVLSDFAQLAGFLRGGHRLVAMDHRCHGKSQDGPWTWDLALADMRKVVAHSNPYFCG